MPQHDFKPGDRVRYRGSSLYLRRGSLGTIAASDGSLLTVAWDGFIHGHDGEMGDTSRRDFWFAGRSELEHVP